MVVYNFLPVIKKEFRQISRDKRGLGMMIFLPAFLLALVGYALNFDVKRISIVVCDEDRTSQSRSFLQGLAQTEYFEYVGSLNSRNDIDKTLDEGTAKIAVVIPKGFTRDLNAGRPSIIQVIVDGSNSNTASIASNYLKVALQEYSINLMAEWFVRGGRKISLPIELNPRFLYNPNLTTTKYLLPGLFGVILMIVTVVSTSLSIVREKELGTMEQLRTSPLRAPELIIGKLVPYLFIALLSATFVIVLGYVVFGVSCKGNLLLLYTAILLFLIAGLGQGLIISSVANTQQIAFVLGAFSSLLPSFLLSGFVFPIESMPIILQVIARVLPTTYFLKIVRSVMLKGVGIIETWQSFLVLITFAFFTVTISSVRLKREWSR